MGAHRPSLPSTRRALVLAGIGTLAQAFALPAQAHDQLGPLAPPLPAPPLVLTLHDGRSVRLEALLRGRTTAMQLMFTGCSAACPIQGAIFAALQPLVVGVVPAALLLSLSIDPLSDDAAALVAWRKRFGAGDAWLAAAPPVRHAQVVPRFLAGGQSPPASAVRAAADRHSAQTYLFDTRGRLAYRMAELSAARDIAAAMQQLAARG
jgi:protein SCO1/2